MFETSEQRGRPILPDTGSVSTYNECKEPSLLDTCVALSRMNAWDAEVGLRDRRRENRSAKHGNATEIAFRAEPRSI